jgi:hypothetical protein
MLGGTIWATEKYRANRAFPTEEKATLLRAHPDVHTTTETLRFPFTYF